MHPAMSLRGVQARFIDPESMRRISPASYVHQVSDYLMAAIRAGLALERISEHAVDDELAQRSPRAAKYVGWPMLLLMKLVPTAGSLPQPGAIKTVDRRKGKRQRTDRTPRPCGFSTAPDSAVAFWSAVSPLPLFLESFGVIDSFNRSRLNPPSCQLTSSSLIFAGDCINRLWFGQLAQRPQGVAQGGSGGAHRAKARRNG